jgi:hypothetical protein
MQPNLCFMEGHDLTADADVTKLFEVPTIESRPLAKQLLLDGEVVR